MIRILLVDDDAQVLSLLTKYLERLGYQVDACLTPTQALALFTADPTAYSLVMSDLSLAEMSGDQMIAQMRAMEPNLRAIIASGYPYEPQNKWTGFLQKPFLPKMLAEQIETILNRP